MDIKVTQIPVSELKPFVEVAFLYDKNLWTKFQDTASTYEGVVWQTYDRIKDACSSSDFACYKMESATGSPVGFTVTYKGAGAYPSIYSFGIHVGMRTSGIKADWLAWVEETLGLPFTVTLNPKNKRAIRFFEKNGFETVPQDNKHIVLLVKV